VSGMYVCIYYYYLFILFTCQLESIRQTSQVLTLEIVVTVFGTFK
jgi:hypothetical protein